jgi:hypothetical protein
MSRDAIQRNLSLHAFQILGMKPGLSDIQLGVWDDEIFVSLPGTDYAVTYYKRATHPSFPPKISLTTTMDALS